MDIYEIRRRNLWALAHPNGYSDQGVKKIADKSGKSEQRIRHLINKSPDDSTAKTIGSVSAREFERVFKLPDGWLDKEHPEIWGINSYRISRLEELIWFYGGLDKLADQMDEDEDRLKLLLNRSIAFEDSVAREFEATLSLPNLWFDIDEHHNFRNVALSGLSVDYSKPDNDYITIQQYTDVRGAMGKGAYLQLEEVGEVVDWRVTPEWANKQLPSNTGIDNLRIITGLGDSMKGLYNSGDPLIVDTGIRSVDYDAVYFFRVGDEGYVKRLQKTPRGILVISQNTDYRDWTIEPDMDLEVFGRVLKVWEGKDL